MISLRSSCVSAVAAGIIAFAAGPAGAQGQLNIICSVQADWCNLAAVEFEKATGIKTTMTLKGSGESMAQLAAEKANPKLDVWFERIAHRHQLVFPGTHLGRFWHIWPSSQ